MHLTTPLTLALPALAAAQAQKPLTDQVYSWFNAATSSLLSAVPSSPTVPAELKHPVQAAAAKGASLTVHRVTMANWETLLAPDPARSGPTEWMVLVTGGNKTCGGHCTQLEVNFNETASLLAADATAPKLGYINCDDQAVLCATWAIKPPVIWHIQRPAASNVAGDQSVGPSIVTVNYLNFTRTTAQDMVALHTGKKYETTGYVNDGLFQPFDGPLAQYGVLKAVGYAKFGVSMIPSWAFMLVVSMGMRRLMCVSHFFFLPSLCLSSKDVMADSAVQCEPHGTKPRAGG